MDDKVVWTRSKENFQLILSTRLWSLKDKKLFLQVQFGILRCHQGWVSLLGRLIGIRF